MTIVFDQLLDNGNIQFDQLNDSFGLVHTHSETVTLTLVDSSTQGTVEAHIHDFVVELGLYDASEQEHIPAGAAPVHNHSETVNLTLLDFSTQEHLAPTPVHDHNETISLLLTDSSTQTHFPGVGVGVEHIDDQVISLTLQDLSQQSHDLSNVSGVVAQFFAQFEGWQAATPSEFNVDFGGVTNARRLTIGIESTAEFWQGGLGPLNGSVRVAVEIVNGSSVLPVASLDQNNPEATIYDGAYVDGSRFDAIVSAIASGQFVLRVGGYEALPDRSIPLNIPGGGTVTLRASA